jgi:hypothetical protein
MFISIRDFNGYKGYGLEALEVNGYKVYVLNKLRVIEIWGYIMNYISLELDIIMVIS